MKPIREIFLFAIFLVKTCVRSCDLCDIWDNSGYFTSKNKPFYYCEQTFQSDPTQKFEFGVWVRFQPFVQFGELNERNFESNLDSQRQETLQGGQFLYSLSSKIVESKYIVLSQKQIKNEMKFINQVFYNFRNQKQTLQFLFSAEKFEGTWILFHMSFDLSQQKTTLSFYNFEQFDPIHIQVIDKIPQFQQILVHLSGGQYYYQNENQQIVILKQFEGKISMVFINFNIDEVMGINSCDLNNNKFAEFCLAWTYSLSNFNQQFNGTQFYLFNRSDTTEIQYSIQGWVKFSQISVEQRATTLIRVTINPNYNNDLQIGDKDFFLQYFQSSNLQENGFELSTYSFTYPTKQRYTTPDELKITVKGENYRNLIQKWHFIQYIYGLVEENYQPLFQIFFPELGQMQQYRWPININHFISEDYYVTIGGDVYSNNYFDGKMSDLEIKFFCPGENDFKIKCHYSCYECFGPTEADCFNCPLNSFRYYSIVTKTCKCQMSYVDIKNNPICQKVNTALTYMQIQEIELKCNKEGFDLCNDEEIRCSFGYFLYQKHCVQCPYYETYQKGSSILCLDCYAYPEIFNQSFTCTKEALTFYENPDNTFQIKVKSNLDIIFYSENYIQEKQNIYLQFMDGFKKINECKEAYFQFNNQCLKCIEGCKVCLDKVSCNECYVEYGLIPNNKICKKCSNGCQECLFSEDQKIEYCKIEDIYSLLQYKYVQKYPICGNYCQSCDQNGFCNYCYQDQQSYFQSFDGVNCQVCNIENCKYCISYIQKDDGFVSTVDINFSVYNDVIYDIKIACALCQPNYYYNQQTKECQLKNIQNDCEFAIIDNSQIIKCIIGTSSENAVQVNDCSELTNCQQCIKQYFDQFSFCILCMNGYYSEIKSGQCQKCPDNCKTCIEQNKIYQDSWKWEIKTFYKYLINQNNDHSFEQFALTQKNDEYEIICLSCYENFILHNQQCLKICDSGCQNCQIIDNKSICIKCYDSGFIKIKTQNDEGNCIICPQNCVTCLDRTEQEIKLINPYFISTSKNSYQTKLCVEKQKNEQENEHYYYDSNLKTVRTCFNFEKCEHKAIITSIVHCNYGDFVTERNANKNKDPYFLKKHIYISSFFFGAHFDLIDSQQIWTILEELGINSVLYEFYFKSGNVPCHSDMINENINLQVLQNVFNVQQIDIKFIGLASQTLFLVEKQIKISNFTNIIFENLIISFATDNTNFKLFNLQTKMNLQFLNVGITTTSNLQSQHTYFQSDQLFSLMISNVNIYKIKFVDSLFIYITSNSQNQVSNVEIKNLKIYDCNIKSSSIFSFTPRSSQINIIIENLVINNTKFINSSFITSKQLSVNDFITFQTKLLKFNKINLQNSSFIFYIDNAKELLFESISFEQSQLQNSQFYLGNIIQLKDLQIIDITLYQSNLFSNQISTLTFEKKALQILITNSNFSNILYDQQQSLVYIVSKDQKNQQQVIIEGIVITNNKFINQQVFSEISYSHSIIQITCYVCKFENINLERGYGLPEITILNSSLIEINNFRITQNQNYYSKILHSNFDCVKQFAQLNLFFVIYFGEYKNISINNLIINSTISFNSPLIIFQGYNLLDKQQNETISIQNSYFAFNQLIIYKAFSQSGILALNSEQNSNVVLNNIIFASNHLNEYYQDISIISATLFVFQQRQGILQIFQCIFFNNIITNSTNSILYISTSQVKIQNTQFQQNNWIDYNQLVKNILLQNSYLSGQKSLTASQLKKIFPVSSQSGNGYISVSKLLIYDIQINKSYSNNGAGFYVYLKGNSSVLINESKFYQTQASFQYSVNSQGGCLFIYAQQSSLNLKIINTVFNTISSRKEGGGIYIVPSLSYNFVQLENITVFNNFAITSSFLSYKLTQTDQLYSQLNIINSRFQQTELGFKDFLTKLENLQTSETLDLVYNRPLIETIYGNIFISNCSFISSYLTFLANFDQANQIIMEELIILNVTVYYSSLFKLSLGLYQPGQIIVKNCQVINTQLQKTQNSLTCNIPKQSLLSSLECPNQQSLNKINKISLNTSDELNFFNCNHNSFFSQNQQNFSLLEINNLQSFHQLRIQNLILLDNQCDKCYNGILRIYVLAQQNIQNIIINKLQISQSSCGYTGCLSIITNSNSSWIRNDLLNNRILQLQNYDKIKGNFEYQVLIQNSQFLNNIAQLGGALLGIEIQILIMNCIFNYNSAKIGGAIYYFSSIKQLFILDSKIQYNIANIAGGLFLNDQSLQELNKLEVILDENNSTFTGSNVYETPRTLTLITNQDYQFLEKKQVKFYQDQIIEQIIIQPYKVLGKINKEQFLMLPSGRAVGTYEYFDKLQQKFIPYNLTLRIIALNKINQQVKGLDGHICKITPTAINFTSQEIVNNLYYALSYYNTTYNSISEDFNFDDLIIYFNPNYESDLVLRLIFTCDFINYPIQDENPPYLITHIIQNYQLQVDIQTFDCQIGEFLNSTSGGCVLCDSFQNQYQVAINAQNCSYKEDLKMSSIQSSMIELRPHFWRAYYYSSTIEFCQHLDVNCLGGWYPGDKSCIIGHIGALCEQCDLYNTKGDGSYSVSSTYSCGSCENISRNVISIIFISIWTLISIIMSVNSTVEMINEFIINLKFSHFGIVVGVKTASTAILIKVLTNYLQIITTITTFQLQVPIGVITAFNSAGNPIENMAYSLDCFLVSISNIDIIYFRIIWSLLMETFQILTFFIIELLAVSLNIIKYNTSQITTALLYIFIFLQPNLISSLISLLSYRTISDEKWVQGNVVYRYDTYSHLEWSLAFSLPFLLLFSCILPFLLWYGVYKNRQTLDKVQTRQSWGYLYNEYKLQCYYWETVKILQKEFIIIVLSYYDDHIPIKASLIFLILFAYSYMTQENKPYSTSELNLLDSQSTIVCAVSIILASSIYSAQKSNLDEIVWPFYVIIGILNFVFAAKMIIKLFFAYFLQLHQTIDKVKTIINTKFPNLTSKHLFLQKLLELHSVKQARIKNRYSKLRQAIMPQVKKLIELKKNNIEIFQEKLDQSQLNSQLFDNQNQILFTNAQENDQTQKVLEFDPSSQNLQMYKQPENFSLSSPNIVKIYPEEKLIKNEDK